MCIWTLTLSVLAYLTTASAFTCPDDSHTFYHADVSTGCQVYHLCENSQLQTLTCPSGQAFNSETSQCEDASSVNCHETMGDHHHHRHKRGISIDIGRRPGDIRIIIDSLSAESVRPIRQDFKEKYLGILRKVEADINPYIEDRISGQMRRIRTTLYSLMERSFERFYISYRLSNETHIAILPMNDLFHEYSDEFELAARLWSYAERYIMEELSPKSSHSRFKREMPDLVLDLARPIIEDMLQSIRDTLLGVGDNVMSKVILPTVYDMLGDPETRYDLLKLFVSAKAAFGPLSWEIMDRQSYDTPEGTVIKVPVEIVDAAVNKFQKDTMPIIEKLARKYLGAALHRAGDSVAEIIDGLKSLNQTRFSHAGVLRDLINRFYLKHAGLFYTSTSTQVHFYPVTEILNDLRPIKGALINFLADYFLQGNGNLIGDYIGEESLLHKTIMGPTVYAKPKPKWAY